MAGKRIVQSEEYGAGLGVVDLKMDRTSGEVTVSKTKMVTIYNDRVEPDPGVAALVERYDRRVAPLSDRVVGTAAETVSSVPTKAGESPLGDFVADGQRALAGADFALVPTGGLRTDVAPGPATYGELFEVQPSGREVLKMGLTGGQVRRALEKQFGPSRDHRLSVSGLRYAYDPSGPAGRRVTALTLPDGRPIGTGERYSVAVNGFLAAGGGGFEVFKEGEDARAVGTDVGALVAHAGESPQPFSAPDPNRNPRVTIGP